MSFLGRVSSAEEDKLRSIDSQSPLDIQEKLRMQNVQNEARSERKTRRRRFLPSKRCPLISYKCLERLVPVRGCKIPLFFHRLSFFPKN